MATHPEKRTKNAQTQLTDSEFARVEKYRSVQVPIPTRSTALRELILKGLESWENEATKPKSQKD